MNFTIVLDYLKNYYEGNEQYLIMAGIALLYFVVFEKDVRQKYIIPLVLMVFIILNPILYEKVFYRIEYWRLFWIFSIHLLIVSAIICLIKRIKYEIVQFVVFAGLCFMIFRTGTNVYDTELFSRATTLEKLPDGIIEICDEMLRLEDEPRVIPDIFFSCYDRQYSGTIKQLYGRDSFGFISTITGRAKEIRDASHEGDFYTVLSYAVNNGYQFIVMEDREIYGELEMFGFEEIKKVITSDHTFYLYYHTHTGSEE